MKVAFRVTVLGSILETTPPRNVVPKAERAIVQGLADQGYRKRCAFNKEQDKTKSVPALRSVTAYFADFGAVR